jgi:hypothetical protein
MNVNYDELILLAIGAFLTILGFGKSAERKKLLTTGIKVSGTVIGLESEIDGDNMVSLQPVIKYETLDRKWITQTYAIGSNPSPYRIGDSLDVIYDEADNNHFIIDNNQTKLLGPFLIGVGVLLIIGVIIYFFINQYPAL